MLFFSILVFVLGLVLGSFSNVLIWRIPKGLSIKGRSFCDTCRSKIFWNDNIPLLSYILLRGKCRKCKSKISLRYPLVEFTSGIIFLLLLMKFGFSLETLFLMILSPILISIFFIDLDHQIIPDNLVFSGIIISFLYLLLFTPQVLYLNLFSGFLSSLFLLILYFITREKGMGLGDVKFAVLAGMILGFSNIFHWLFLAFLTGAVIGCILILISKKINLKSKIAFGPFLIFALYLVLFLRY